MRLYFLGTGSAVPLSRGLPCIALRCGGSTYLLDSGEGCQARLLRTGLGVVKLKAVFITHLHGDHFLGLFGMLQSMHMLGRKTPLTIIGPRGLRGFLDFFIKESAGSLGFDVEFIEASNGANVYYDNDITVRTYSVEHGIEAYGYVIDTRRGGIRIVYTGDTTPCEATIEEAKGANVLIHEATFDSSMAEEAHSQGHSTAADAGAIAARSGVEKLVLTHISARYDADDVIFYDAYRFFRNTIVARDYMMLVV